LRLYEVSRYHKTSDSQTAMACDLSTLSPIAQRSPQVLKVNDCEHAQLMNDPKMYPKRCFLR
jgi:hypothetical protein